MLTNNNLCLVSKTNFNFISSSAYNVFQSYSDYFGDVITSSRFISKGWKTKSIFFAHPINSYGSFKSIHYLIKFIKSWDPNIRFFVSARFSCPFSKLNFNRLRNIFIKYFEEEKLWFEIEKMFNLSVLNMSLNSIYWGNDIFSFSILARFLFEVYLNELDNYLVNLLSDTNFFCKLANNKVLNSEGCSTLLLTSIPIKFYGLMSLIHIYIYFL